MADDPVLIEIASLPGVADPAAEGSLAGLRALDSGLSAEEREAIVQQALLLLDQVYVHLPLKRAMHAVDPVQRLRLLRRRSPRLSDRRFHDELLSIFTSLRDIHTTYTLPEPYRGKTAFLPFLVEEFYDGDRQGYLVSKLQTGFTHDTFRPGVVVHHWNGMPFDRAVALNADRQPGSNQDARHARGLEAMTIRHLESSLPPDEEWVVVSYTADGTDHHLLFTWRIIEPTLGPQGVNPFDADDPAATRLGIDSTTEAVRRAKKVLFAPRAMEAERAAAAAAAEPTPRGAEPARPLPLSAISVFPDVFEFRPVDTPSGRFGYVRIRTFDVDDVSFFVKEFLRLLALLPQDGLILDVRGNPGGQIAAGEMLLQLLTPKVIEPCRLHFLNTPLTLEMTRRDPKLAQWSESIAQAVETGATFSYGFPTAPVEEYNAVGQWYFGPVVLITDALCYSTTDVFAAGFQDHAIGPILGTSGNTGAGGANVWTHEVLRRTFSDDRTFVPLPKGASFRVALRRTTRVGERSGVPLEDLGVVPDQVHHMTRADVLGSNEDLIAAAGALLAGRPVRALAVTASVVESTLEMRATCRGVTRLDLVVDGRPALTVDVADGVTELRVPVSEGGHDVELRGFEGRELVAARRMRV